MPEILCGVIMEYVFLKHDGRCTWLENKILKGHMPRLLKEACDPFGRKVYVILDWISHDRGKVGVDLSWLKSLGAPVVQFVRDLPAGNDYAVVNTGYDSIVHEEFELRARGVEIVDLPCPFIRKLRRLFESVDPTFQYVFLCEPNHILMKNFVSLFPEDMILVQWDNYQHRIREQSNGKPFRLVNYVTFLPSQIQTIFKYIQTSFPDRNNTVIETYCMWIKSSVSPIREIEQLDQSLVEKIAEALVITTPGSTNKSLLSLLMTLTNRGMKVATISSLKELLDYEQRYKNESRTVLLVRSPIPNKAEKPILAYLKSGLLSAYGEQIKQSTAFKIATIGLYTKGVYMVRLLAGVAQGRRLNHQRRTEP